MGTGGTFPGVKPPERETDNSPSRAEIKNEWSYTSTLVTMSSWSLQGPSHLRLLLLVLDNNLGPFYVSFSRLFR